VIKPTSQVNVTEVLSTILHTLLETVRTNVRPRPSTSISKPSRTVLHVRYMIYDVNKIFTYGHTQTDSVNLGQKPGTNFLKNHKIFLRLSKVCRKYIIHPEFILSQKVKNAYIG